MIPLTLTEFLEIATSSIPTAFGSYGLMGLGIVIILGYLAWVYRPSLPTILFTSVIVMGVLGAWAFISNEVIYSALIIVGIIAGIGIGRMVGAI